MALLEWLIPALVVVVLTVWITFTLTRLDRLHARVDAAGAALDAQLVRRAAALLHVAESPDSGAPDGERARYDKLASAALSAGPDDPDREALENNVGRALLELTGDAGGALRHEYEEELREAAARVLIARRFYNDAVRDTRALRARRMPRWLHLAGHRQLPQFFDIDDTVPS
jgi:hypothetical protein